MAAFASREDKMLSDMEAICFTSRSLRESQQPHGTGMGT